MKPLSKISTREIVQKAKYNRVIKEIDERFLDVFGYIFCTSCGIRLASYDKSYRIWGHSHNLPKGRFKQLECDPENISPRCQNWGHHKGCHEKLDSDDINQISKFNDFKKLLNYRKTHAPQEYNKWLSAMDESGIEHTYSYVEIK